MSKKSFMQGAAILGFAGIIIKGLGACFRIPLINIIGDEGIGYYQTAYPIYVLLLTLSSAGLPTAIAKMVSERTAEENHAEAHRIFRVSFSLMFAIGLASAAVLFFGADKILELNQGNPNAIYSMKAIAPALLFVPMMAAYRGYFQGLQDMKPTAASQVIEQLFRVVVGLVLALMLVQTGLPWAAAGASFGATAGGIGGLLAVVFIYMRQRQAIRLNIRRTKNGERETAGAIIRKIIWIAVPITIGAAIMPIMNNIDLAIVMGRLGDAGYSPEAANAMYGQLSGMAASLINFPQVLTQSVAMSLVPAVAAAHKIKDTPFLRYNVELGLRTSMIIGLPCAIGLFVLAEPIMVLLYPNTKASAISAAPCLAILAIGVIFLSSVQTLTGILQGVGKQAIPVRNLFIGALFKVVITYILTGIPGVDVKGAAAGTVCAYLVASTLNLVAVKKYTGVKFNLSLTVIKPLFSACAMGVIVWGVYHLMVSIAGNAMSTLIAVLCGVILYAFLMLATKGITDEELLLLPKGGRLVAISSKFRKRK